MAYVGNPIDVIKNLHQNKQWDDIVSFCQKMLLDDPKDMVALQNMATAFLNLGKFDEVLSCCDIVLEQNEFDEYAVKNKVFALEKLGKHDQILQICDRMLEKNSSNAWILTSKGLALNETGSHDKALECYNKALEIEPTNVTASLNMGITFSFLQKYDSAISYYDMTQKQEKNSRAAIGKSAAYQKLGKEDEAFLAAQGLLVDDINRIVSEARAKKMKVFDYYCISEYEDLEKREQAHQEKLNSKLR